MAGQNNFFLLGCVGILVISAGFVLITYGTSNVNHVDITKGVNRIEKIVKIERVNCSGNSSCHEVSTEIQVDGTSYQVPETIRLRLPWQKYTVAKDANPKQIALMFKHSVRHIQAECMRRARIGSVGDGGWDICLSGPYAPKPGCIIYDFGIANMWTYDDEITTKFGCQVRAFDPTIGLAEHNRSDLIHFYPVGLSGQNGNVSIAGKNCQVKTLGTLINDMGDADKIIDFLKIDIESSEWTALPTAMKEGVLPFVKQIGLEIHGKASIEAMAILNDIYDHGFRKWHHHWNFHCLYKDENGIFTFCNELYYINVNFLKSS